MGFFEDWANNVKANPVQTALMPGIGLTVTGLNALQGNRAGENNDPKFTADAASRDADMEAGYKKGRETFYDDPEMIKARGRLEDLSKGYNGKELGAMRATATNEIQGQRGAYLRELAGNAGKAGVGGARAAAMGAAANDKFLKTGADAERKMTMDNAQLTRQGTSDFNDFVMRQKFGELGTGLGYAELGVTDRTGARAATANAATGKKGLFGQMFEGIF